MTYLDSEMRISDIVDKASALVRSSSFFKAMVIDDESPCRLTDKTMTSSIMKSTMLCDRIRVVLVLEISAFRGEKSRRTRPAGPSVELIAPFLTGSVRT